MITVEYPKHPVRTADVTALCVSASASPLSAWWSPKNTLFRSSFSPSKIQTEHEKKIPNDIDFLVARLCQKQQQEEIERKSISDKKFKFIVNMLVLVGLHSQFLAVSQSTLHMVASFTVESVLG